MGNGSGQFTHCREPGNPSKLPLGCVQASSGLFQPLLSSLLLAQIEHKCNAIALAAGEQCAADDDGYSTSIFREVLLLVWLGNSSGVNLFYRMLVAATPFTWR